MTKDAFDLVIGLGVSGRSVLRYLQGQGMAVRALDTRQAPAGLDDLHAEFPKLKVHTGGFKKGWMERARRLIVSPGVAISTPAIAAQNGSTWSAPGNAMIVLPDALTTGSAIEVRRTSGQGELLFLGQSPSAEAAREELPQSLGILDAVNTDTATFAAPGTVLWVRTDGPWTLVIEPLRAETVDSAVSGTGTRYVRYDGPSNTAEFRHEGDGTITVEVLTAAEREAPVISLGVIDQQLTWASSAEVVFHIIAEPGAVWSLSVDEGTP